MEDIQSLAMGRYSWARYIRTGASRARSPNTIYVQSRDADALRNGRPYIFRRKGRVGGPGRIRNSSPRSPQRNRLARGGQRRTV